MIATPAGTCDRFAAAAEKLLPKRAGRRPGESPVERTTEAAGQRPDAQGAHGPTLGPNADGRGDRDAQGRTIATVSVDATGVGIQGEGGAQADGRRVSGGKVFHPRPEPTEALPKPHPGTARSQAGWRDRDALGTRRRPAAQVGMDRAEPWVALTAGGAGRDDFRDVSFPRAVRILDFSHAAEHLGDLAKASCGGDAAAAEGLTEQRSPQLTHEGGAALLATLEVLDLDGRSAAARGEHRPVTGPVRNDVHRMDDPRDRAEGWPLGSGPLEAACQTVVNPRLKQSGRRWGSDGADAVRHLRALDEGESGQWDAYWERSIN